MCTRSLGPLALLLALLPPATQAQTVRVPQDYETIQEAVDGAADGSLILISSGTYQQRVELDGRKGITLRGRGKVTVDGGFSKITISIEDCSDITIEKLTVFNGNPSSVQVVDSKNVTVSRCIIQGASLNAVDANGSPGLLVEKCRIGNCAGRGVVSEDADGVVVRGNRIEKVGTDGVRVSTKSKDVPNGSPLALISGNRIENTGDDGIEARGSRVRVAGNRIVKTGDDGVETLAVGPEAGNDYITISGNLVRQASGHGLNVKGQGNTAERNRLRQVSGTGIVLAGHGRHTVKRNVIRKPGADGIECLDSGSAPADGNRIERNKVDSAVGDGLLIETTGNDLRRNRLTRSAADGVRVVAGGNLFERNKALKSQVYDLSDTSDGSNVYVDNTFKTVDPDGQSPGGPPGQP